MNYRINETGNELNKFLPKELAGETNLNTQKFINRMEKILKDKNSIAFKSNILIIFKLKLKLIHYKPKVFYKWQLQK